MTGQELRQLRQRLIVLRRQVDAEQDDTRYRQLANEYTTIERQIIQEERARGLRR